LKFHFSEICSESNIGSGGESSHDCFLFLYKFQIANGVLQKPPPIVPMKITVARVLKSLFGDPADIPNTGIIKVRNEIGIKCFSETSSPVIFGNILFTVKAEIRITARNENIATSKPIPVTPLNRFKLIREPINPPVINPDSRIFFQFILIH
tara:strand:+ start:2513 stop:2968 length:456 start_codon:yes stop_codon:yes gene_type:complete